MKKFIISLFVSIVALCWISVALDIPVTELSSLASCNPNETDNVNYYLTNNGYSRNPYDTFRNNVDSLIWWGNNGSSINIWRHGVISNCNIWNRVSNVVDGDDQNWALVFLNTDNCIFNIPNYTKTSNPTAIDAQIHYTIWYRLVFDGWSNTITDKFYYRDYGVNNWTCYPNWNTVSDSSNCPNVTLKYWSQKYHTWECLNYRVFRCWDWLVNSPYGTTYRNWAFTEQCDPNDPTQAWWNNNWYTCNSSCQLVQNTPNPQCNSTYSWTHYTNTIAYPNWLNQNMNLCTQWTVTNFTNRWSWYGHAGHYSWTCSNSAGSINCTANQNWCWDWIRSTSNGEQCDPNDPNQTNWWVWGCNSDCTKNNTPTPYCWDGILQSNEQCDPGSGNFWNGCNSNCQLMTPSCTLTVNPNQWTIPLTTTINGNKPSWATYTNLLFGDWQSQTNPTFALTHTYTTVWTFNLTLTVQNNYNGQVNWTKPTATCSASVTATQPWSPVPYLLKQQKTWGMANFTTNQINVEIWDIITYKVNFWNSGTVAATWEVWDILPPCTNYLTSSIYLPAWTTYNWPTVWPVNAWNQTMVKYSNFRLNPGQGWYMLIQAQVRWTWMDWMTSCQNVHSYLNTWYFKFVWWNTLSSQVIAIRPEIPQNPHLTINKELLTAWDMTAWSTVVYKITLTNDWNATYHNAYILDVLPNAIQYQTSSIQNVTNYLFEQWTTWNNEYYFKYYNFNLNAGQSAIVYLTWILKEWFAFSGTTNCAFTSGDDSCVLFPSDPIPFIKKWQKVWNMSFTDEIIQVELGDTITYKVDFWNIWNRWATWQVWDVLPPCIKYVSSSIYLPNDISYSWPHTGQQWVQDFVMYNNFYLSAWQTWYMLIEAEIKESWIPWVNCSDTRSYLNTWYFKFIWWQRLSSDVLAIREEAIASEVIFDKTGNKKIMHPWEDWLEFYITVTNKGPNPISDIYVDDIWPDDCIIYKWRTGDESLIEYIDPLRRHYIWLQEYRTNYSQPWEPNSSQTKWILYAWQSFGFTIFASIKDDPACVGPYVNKAQLAYTEWWQTYTLDDDYDFEVIDDNSEFLCESLTSSGSIVMLTWTNNQWKMKFTCEASDWKPHKITIDCGNLYSYSTWNASSFKQYCTYWASDEWKSYNVTCYIDDEETQQNPACIKNIWINPGLYWECGNGIIEAGEDCDLKWAEWQSIIISDWLDYYWTIRAGQHEWDYCKNCKIITGNNFVYEPAECLYSDTPISVMENEIMPFWWRLWLKDNQVVGDNGCDQDSTYTTSDKSTSSNTNSSLSPRSNGTLLRKNSMDCTFSIYNWSNKLQWTTNSKQTFTLPCFNNQGDFTTLEIYKYFRENHKTENFNWGTEILTVNTLLNWINSSTRYWEYKLVLEKVDYEYCDKTVWQWKKWKRYWAVCEVDFAVTKPYMMQVSTFGANPVWSNSLSSLDDYYDMNWQRILNSTDLKETIDTQNSSYAVSSDAKAQMDTFKSKYEKLAVKVNTSSVKNLFGWNTNWIESVSKVPNQSIYFVKWNWGTLTLSQDEIRKTAAYTLFIENANIEIEWEFLQYAMIITDGTISFKDAWDSTYRCAQWWQVVQWIFVALNGFKESTPSLVNTNKNTARCARWWLHVKWVLIWKNIDKLITGRRSQLNSWFNVNYVWWTPQKIKTERKKKIMEWAALLIEYSPELWKSLPPWAEIFTESLQVYRK